MCVCVVLVCVCSARVGVCLNRLCVLTRMCVGLVCVFDSYVCFVWLVWAFDSCGRLTRLCVWLMWVFHSCAFDLWALASWGGV